jgi:hypothetical protein
MIMMILKRIQTVQGHGGRYARTAKVAQIHGEGALADGPFNVVVFECVLDYCL